MSYLTPLEWTETPTAFLPAISAWPYNALVAEWAEIPIATLENQVNGQMMTYCWPNGVFGS